MKHNSLNMPLKRNCSSAHSFGKLKQLKAYSWIYKRALICFSETYLESIIHNSLLEIKGNNFVLEDHTNNIKKEVELAFITKKPSLFES